jgi:hypothetical protein
MNSGNIPARISSLFSNYTQGTTTKPLVNTNNPLSIAMTHFNEPIFKPEEGKNLSTGKQVANAINLLGNTTLIGLGVICPPVLAVYALSIGLSKGCEVCAKKLEEHNLNDVNEAIKNTKPIDRQFTTNHTIEQQRRAHAKAKNFLTENLGKLGAKVEFLRLPQKAPVEFHYTSINSPLDSSVFSWEISKSVQADIKEDGNRKENNVIIYGIASQFNASESTTPSTFPPGEAKHFYSSDHTQGPEAQLSFSDQQVEIINCGANIGFNGLCHVLDENTKSTVTHGYLLPNANNGSQILDRLTKDGNKTEYLCVANKPTGGNKPVHQVLLSAPAFGDYEKKKMALDDKTKNEIQFNVALNGYRVLFQKGIDEAEAKKGKEVIIKPAAIGLGAFANNPEAAAKAYWLAAYENQAKLKELGVQVRFQIFESPKDGMLDANAEKMKDLIGLQKFEPKT